MSAIALLIAELLQRRDGGFHDVMRVVRTDRFRQYVRDTDRLNHGTNRSTGNDAGTFRSRL